MRPLARAHSPMGRSRMGAARRGNFSTSPAAIAFQSACPRKGRFVPAPSGENLALGSGDCRGGSAFCGRPNADFLEKGSGAAAGRAGQRGCPNALRGCSLGGFRSQSTKRRGPDARLVETQVGRGAGRVFARSTRSFGRPGRVRASHRQRRLSAIWQVARARSRSRSWIYCA